MSGRGPAVRAAGMVHYAAALMDRSARRDSPFDPWSKKALEQHRFFNMKLNRPFLFIVQDNTTDIILLLGLIREVGD